LPSNKISDISGIELETVRCVVRGIESNPEKRESTSTVVLFSTAVLYNTQFCFECVANVQYMKSYVERGNF
jgi:hypothetical protein